MSVAASDDECCRGQEPQERSGSTGHTGLGGFRNAAISNGNAEGQVNCMRAEPRLSQDGLRPTQGIRQGAGREAEARSWSGEPIGRYLCGSCPGVKPKAASVMEAGDRDHDRTGWKTLERRLTDRLCSAFAQGPTGHRLSPFHEGGRQMRVCRPSAFGADPAARPDLSIDRVTVPRGWRPARGDTMSQP